MKVTPAIEASGYGVSGHIGGLPRQTYYTPDGRTVKAIPSMREYVRKENGKVIESGTRDANYDKGWLQTMPTELKHHCSHCREWHNSQEEVDACGVATEKRSEWGDRLARKYKKEEHEDIKGLKSEIDELKEMVKKLTEAKVG